MTPILIIEPTNRAKLEAALRSFPSQAARAVMRAVNRAGQSAKTQAKRIISKELGIQQADLTRPHRFGAVGSQSTGEALRLEKASPEKLTATLHVSGKRIPVIYFKARSTPLTWQAPIRVFFRGRQFVARRRGTGVGWTIGSHSSFAKQAFVGRSRRGDALGADVSASGHVGVWVRRGAKRLPITELKGPSIPYVASKNAALRRALDVDVRAVLNQRIDHELKPILAGQGLYGGGDGSDGGE